MAGKPPSKNEFAAVLAACEERARSANQGGALDGCLADYGLRRVRSRRRALGYWGNSGSP